MEVVTKRTLTVVKCMLVYSRRSHTINMILANSARAVFWFPFLHFSLKHSQ